MRPGTLSVRHLIVALVSLASALPLKVSAQSNSTTTFSNSTSTQSGTINAQYNWVCNTVGPGVIDTGALTGCTLVGSPPFPGCDLGGGTGAANDPFVFACASPLTLAGCSGGQPFNVLAGTENFNFHSHTVIAIAAAPTQPVPLAAWVPLASVGGVLLTALFVRRRRRT